MLVNSHTDELSSSLLCTYSNEDSKEILSRSNVLAVIDFTGKCELTDDPRHVNSGLAAIAPQQYKEVWTTPLPTKQGRNGRLSWALTSQCCFLSYHLEGNQSIERDFYQAYQELLKFLHQADYPHIQRIWNYVSNINVGDGDDEHYKLFCAARHAAFREAALQIDQFPAACAIGQYTDNSIVYLLATKMPGTHFENPRQIAAYHYPRQYGISSPSFARATLTALPNQQQIFLSGTASVLGHETKHADDPAKQLDETILNIDALMKHVAEHSTEKSPEPVLLKVYLRHPDLYRTCRQKLRDCFGRVPILYLHGDICRSDLALEIDGLYQLTSIS